MLEQNYDSRRFESSSSKARAEGVNRRLYDAIPARIASIRLGGFSGFSVKEPLVALSRDTNTIFATDLLGVNLGGTCCGGSS